MSQPTFTLVVPTYNGGGMLRQCIASLLAQRYESYDILVLDDGSSDGSVEWLRGLAEPRLRVEQSSHVGIVENWRRATEFPLGEYMTFVGQDDLLDPEFLPVMAGLIRQFPDAGLYHAHFRFVDETGRFLRNAAPMPDRATAAEYLQSLFGFRHETYGTGYVWRAEDYRQRGGIPPYPGLLFADDALWFILMRGSYKVTSRQVCFSCRLHTCSAGRSAAWTTWLAAMREYIGFLKGEAGVDEKFASALRQYAPGYFLRNALNLYALALVQATKAGRSAEAGIAEEIESVLSLIVPEKGPEFRAALGGKGMRLRQLINRNPVARGAYNAYLLLRYREWRGKHLSGRTAAWRG
jgi:glycosyltransferase involved in cell wall biosynthesis